MSDKRFSIGITIGAALAGGFSRATGDAKRTMNALGATMQEVDKKRRLLEKFEIDTKQLEQAKSKVKQVGEELQRLNGQMKSRGQNMAGIQTAIANTKAAMTGASKAQQASYRQSLELLQRELRTHQQLPERIDRQRTALQSALGVQRTLTQQAEATKKAIEASGMATSNLKAQYDRLNASAKQIEQTEARRARAKQIAGGMASAAAGGVAGVAVVASAARPVMAYEYRMASLANTAYAGESLESRKAGMEELKAGIMEAIRTGGGTRDTAADTLDTLVASGAFGDGREGIDKSLKMLPALQKFGTASGASSTELAQIAIAASRFNISSEKLPEALDMAIRAGQLGGFELKDMAKWLPQQMAAARQSGLGGMEGFAKLLSVNQASRTTAGTVDEAGNNLVNLLAKINSADTAKDVKKATGLDLPDYLAKQRGKGLDSITAFVQLVDGLASKNKEFVKLRGAAAGMQEGSEKRATTEQMANILQGSAVGQIIQDRQALMGLLAVMNNRDYLKDIETKIDPRTHAAVGTGQANFDLMRGTAQFNAEALANEKTAAQDKAFSELMPSLAGVMSGMTNMAREYPGLSAAVVATTTALGALAAAAGGSALMSLVLSRGAGAGAGAVSGVSRFVGASGAVGRFAGRAAIPLALAASAVEAGSVLMDKNRSGSDKGAALTGIAGGVGGGLLGGAAAGAALGSVLPGIGTIVGGIVGGVLGGIGGRKLGDMAGDAIFKRTDSGRLPADAAAKAATAGAPTTIEKKATLEANYQLTVNGIGKSEMEEMISQKIFSWQREQEARLRANLSDGGAN